MKLVIRTGLFCFILIFFLMMPLTAEGEEESVMILAYADDESAVEITDADNLPVDTYIGMELTEGASIFTKNTNAELQLKPNGSIIKMDSSTSLTIEGFQKDINSANDFTLKRGKLRVVATRTPQNGENYNVFTQSSICGVRGTDFLIDGKGRLVVSDGIVEFIKKSTGEAVRVSSGMTADVFAEIFQPTTLTTQELSEEFQEFRFKNLNPDEVSRLSLSKDASGVPEEEPEPEATRAASVAPAAVGPEKTKRSEKPQNGNPLGELLGMEIGSFTADGQFYSKLLLQPTFSIGKLKLALYLPIIYQDDIFDPGNWYKPAGNNEWSFGSDQDDGWDIAADAVRDLFMKIRYLKWGKQGDPFYFKLGNLNDMTLGHGILMLNYANDVDFPAVRKVGLNLGINTPKITLELVGDDLANPQIFGTRLAFRPFDGFPLGFGFSGVTDINPAKDIEEDLKLIYINPAFDLDFPIFKNDLLSFVLFGDIAAMLPVVDCEVKTEYIYDDESKRFQNYGFATGLFGSIFLVNYRLEYRQSTGQFKPSFYNSTYDRNKVKYVAETMGFLFDSSIGETTRGIYGSLGVDIAEVFKITGGYLWPWTNDGFNPENDYLHLKMTLKPDPLPLGLSFTYDRSGLAKAIEDGFEFIDASTVLKGEIVYSPSPFLDIALLVSSAIERNSNGFLVGDENGQFKAYYTFTIDTRVHF